MRGLGFLLVLLLLAVALRVLLAPSRRREVHTRAAPDQLVKDPVCQVYIVQSRAITRRDKGVVRHFCSPECAREFAQGGSGSRG